MTSSGAVGCDHGNERHFVSMYSRMDLIFRWGITGP